MDFLKVKDKVTVLSANFLSDLVQSQHSGDMKSKFESFVVAAA